MKMGLLSAHDVFKKSRKSLISLTILTSIIAATTLVNCQDQINVLSDSNNLEQLPFCGNEHSRTISRRLIYVTTLDGKLSALDLTNKGKIYWEVPTGPGPLISSSIHRLELTNNGQFVRMIPSLSGSIYKFDGESIDPIPITAENLLSSSFKFNDELVISGGKETRSYGVSARTGQILYECSMHGCVNTTELNDTESPKTPNNYLAEEHDALLDDVVVIRRQTQTVRAIEPRTGNERWNFSVGQHELEIIKSAECHEKTVNKLDFNLLDLSIKVIVPEGIICAFNKNDPNVLLWKHQFDHPIVSAWKTEINDQVKSIDLFESAQWIWDSENDNFIPQEGLISPSIYLGMYHKQLYIQESFKLHQLISDQTNQFKNHLRETDITNLPSIPWKPYPATKSTSLMLLENSKDNNDENNDIEKDTDEDEKPVSVTAISVLYASEYVNGNGFYLYTEKDLNKSSANLCSSNRSSIGNNLTTSSSPYDGLIFDFDNAETPVKIIIISIWYWWKEILVISLTTGLLLNLLLSPRIRREREVVVIERHIAVPTAIEATEESMSSLSRQTRSLSETHSNSSENFSSRFQSDFDLIQCLGKGGFGVVFEARNKLDDCTYAVKRISLPNKKEKRDRVMREVKTLANCEHHNIVRYFQAWVETPPPGWQEEEDLKWLKRDLSTSIEIESPDGTTLPSFPPKYTKFNGAIGDNSELTSSKDLTSWVSKINENGKIMDCSYKRNCESIDKIYDDDDDDSFIQFRCESNENSTTKDQHNHSCSININSKEISHSDSFAIEFEQSENHIHQNSKRNRLYSTNDIANDTDISKSFTAPIKRYSHRRPLSLDLSKALIPIFDNQFKLLDTTKSKQLIMPTIKPNKVYLYIQMQLCRKESLRDWLRDHRIELRAPHTPNIFKQIVNAVDYVHQKGLIHRDLKPGNIFFSLDGQIRIGDFGLVTDMPETPNSSDNSNLGSTGNILNLPIINRHTQQVGTHLYMSPEQLQGISYDFRVDIYSLGLIFFELLVYFSTEMERIKTLKGLRENQYPYDFQCKFPEEHELLKLMLSKKAIDRPATYEIHDKLKSMASYGIV